MDRIESIRRRKANLERADRTSQKFKSLRKRNNRITEKKRERIWRSKFKIEPIIYRAQNGNPRDVRTFLFDTSHILKTYINHYKLKGVDDEDTMYKILMFVMNNLNYVGDQTNKGQAEFWQNPEDTVITMKGDCIAEYEEIYTENGVKNAKDIKEGDLVLSYNFDSKEFVYKPIVKKWDKGKLQIKRVHLRNGQHIDVTDNHHMLVRTNQNGNSIYEKRDLKDVDLSRWWKRKVPIAKKIPYKKSKPGFEKELYVVLGNFLADGWIEKSHVSLSGYVLHEHITPILEKYDIPFSEYKNNSGVPCINILKSEFKKYLQLQKTNSSNIHLSEEILTLPEEYLESLLYGMWLGDGTKNQYSDKRGYENNKEWTYSTSSEQLASDIQRIGLHLGRTFHIWKQENHQGLGNKPIYRINYNSNSHFLKYHGYEDISEVSISYIEDIGEYQTYDWEVEDTHTFIFKNGIITRQCEDGAILIKSLALVAGVSDWKVKIIAGMVVGGGHAYCTFIRHDETQVILDWCYWPNKKLIHERPDIRTENNYKEVWFSFDKRYGYAPKPVEYSNGATTTINQQSYLNI